MKIRNPNQGAQTMANTNYRGCGICECEGGFLISTPKREGKRNREFKMNAATIQEVREVIDWELSQGPDFIHMSEAQKLKAMDLWT